MKSTSSLVRAVPLGKVSGRARFYLVGGRLYHIGIAGPTGGSRPESIDQFLNSFALLDQGPQPSAIEVARRPVVGPPVARQDSTRSRNRRSRRSSPIRRAPASGAGTGSAPVPSPPRRRRHVAPTASAGGASIRSFEWIDENADLVGGHRRCRQVRRHPGPAPPDGLDLPPNTIIEELVVKSNEFHRWITRPNDRFWPVAIFQRGGRSCVTHVAQVGVYSGPQKFDLYVNTGMPDRAGEPFPRSRSPSRSPATARAGLAVQAAGAAARARMAGPDGRAHIQTHQPADVPARLPSPRPRADAGHRGPAVAAIRAGVTEVPVLLKPSAGGA